MREESWQLHPHYWDFQGLGASVSVISRSRTSLIEVLLEFDGVEFWSFRRDEGGFSCFAEGREGFLASPRVGPHKVFLLSQQPSTGLGLDVGGMRDGGNGKDD